MLRLLVCLLLAVGAVRAEEVDLELVLAVDTSRSMDFDELVLQRDGYAAAIEHPYVVARIKEGLIGRIAVTYVDWGGAGNHAVIVPWQIIASAEDAGAFADKLRSATVRNLYGTGISGAIDVSLDLLDSNSYHGLRRVIDVSGDGPNNSGGPVTSARDRAAAAGVVVNGLPIMIKKPRGWYNIENLDLYYADCVITGPGAFVVPVRDYDRLIDAIVRKLVLEIAGIAPHPEARILPAAATDCLIGEKLRRRRFDN